MGHAIRPDDAGILAGVTLVYLILLFVLLARRRSRPLEFTLIVVGLLTGVFAVWCTVLSPAEGATVQVQAGQAGVLMGSGASGAVGRLAVVLVLGGVAVGILNAWASPAMPNREEASRANPQ